MRKKSIFLAFAGIFAGLCALASCGEEGNAKTYDVILQQEGCEDVVLEIGSGKDILVSALPTCQQITGYTVEWDLENVQLTNVKSDIVIKAKATPNEYTITYDAKGGTLSSTTQTVVYDAQYTLYQPVYEDHRFNTWLNGETEFAQTGIWKIADNVSLKASWTQIEYWTLTFKQDGQSDKKVKVEKGKSLATTGLPTTEPKTGYTVEWNLSGVDLSNIQSDLTIDAKETANTYTISYNAGDGTVSSASQEITFDTEYTLLTPTPPTGYYFVYWKDGQNPVFQSGTWNIAKSVVLTAEYAEENENECVITFVQAGQANQTKTVAKGETLLTTELPTPAVKTGYDVAWNLDGISLENIHTNLTVYAKETPKTYTITYKINGVVYGDPQAVAYDQSYTLIIPEKAGYRFEKWQRNGQDFVVNGNWKIDESIVLEAVGQRYLTIKLVIAYDCCLVSTKTVEVDWNATTITLPTPNCHYDEHTFKYWKYDGEKLENLTDIWSKIDENAAEITLTAYCRRNWTNPH